MQPEQQQNNQYQIPKQTQIKTKLLQAIDTLSKISPSSQQVKQCNQTIINILPQQNSLQILLTLLISQSDNQKYCYVIISFINYYLKIQVRPGVGVIRHNKKLINQKIKNLFFCRSITQKSKKMLLTGYQQFLSTLSPQFIRIRRQLADQVINFFVKQQVIQPINLQNIMYIIQALFTNNLETQSLRVLQQNLLMRFINLSLELLRHINGLQQKNNQQFQQKIIWTQKVIKITSLLFINANIDKVALLKSTIIISPNLAHMCIESFKLSTNTNTNTNENMNTNMNINNKIFMIINQQSPSHKSINIIKSQTLKIIGDYLAFLIKSKKNLSDSKYIPVIQTLKQILSYIPIISLQIQGYPTKQLSFQQQQLYKNLLLLLIQSSSIPCLLDIHTQLRDIVLFKLCIPCLMTTQKDKKLAAEDYCHKKQKQINFQDPSNINQAAVSLIQAYADQIYGTIPYLVKSLINLMDFQLTADPRYYQNIPQSLLQTQFFKNHTYFEHFQIALSILSILSYHAEQRDDLSITIQQFIVRRQQFFSRIDIPQQLIVSFLHFCAYYLQNFYKLILQGKANANFHRSLIFHSLQLLNISINVNTKDYINNNTKKIGIQAIDYISNCLIQPYIFSAIFPVWNQKSNQYLLQLMTKLCNYFSYSCNISIIQNIIIDFINKCIYKYYQQNNNYINMPQIIRKQLSILYINKIIQNFNKQIHNQTIAKQKMLQLYSIILIYCNQPQNILQISINLINYILQIQYSYIQQIIDILQIFLSRIIKNKTKQQIQQIKLTKSLQNIIINIIIKAISICDNQKFQNQIFDIIINICMLQLQLSLSLQNNGYQLIIEKLMELYQQKLEQIDIDQQAQIIIQKILYLVMQIAFNKFNKINGKIWLKILEQMIQYLRINYKSYDTITVGKAICICLCCYIQDPQGMQNYLQNRMQGLWDCILDDHLKYMSQTQKKIACITLLTLITKYSYRQIIKDKFVSILKSICIIMYYIYQKNQISWRQQSQQQQSQSQNNSNKSQKSQKIQDIKPWKQPLNKMRQNIFLKNLPDQRVMLRNICLFLKENNSQNFQKFIKDLPIGLQNLVKNKVMMYREQPAMVNKKKMRTILKVKKMEQEVQK